MFVSQEPDPNFFNTHVYIQPSSDSLCGPGFQQWDFDFNCTSQCIEAEIPSLKVSCMRAGIYIGLNVNREKCYSLCPILKVLVQHKHQLRIRLVCHCEIWFIDYVQKREPDSLTWNGQKRNIGLFIWDGGSTSYFIHWET